MIVTAPLHGAVSVIGCTGTGSCPNCVVRYTPNAGYTGPDSFTYKVSNDQAPACTGQATVNLTVCSVTASNESANVCGGASVDIPIHASTTCGQIACSTLMVVTPPMHGIATQIGSTCAFHYVPAPGYSGPDSFTYKVSNDQTPTCMGQGLVSINVCTVNAVDDTGITVCNTAGSSVNIPVLANDSTSCGLLDCSSLMIVTPPAHGSAMIVGCTGTGACAGCVVKYTPTIGYTGPDAFTYKVSNNLTPACMGMASVSITVCGVNAQPDSATVCAGSSVDIPVLANDSPTCGNINCATLTITTRPAHGIATVQGCTGTGACAGCVVHYTPTPGYVGADSFAYRVANDQTPACTGMATVSITVCAVNAMSDSATVCSGSSVDIPVLANDSTSCGALDCSSLMIVTPTAHGSLSIIGCTGTGNCAGCVVHYTSTPGYTGADAFTYKVSNNQNPACTGQATVNINVCSVTASNENASVCSGASVDIPVHATTSCGQIDCSTLMIVTPPAHATVTQVGSTCAFHYVPTPGFTGPDSFTYKVSNNQNPACTGQGTVTVTVCGVNAVNDSGFSVCSGSMVTIPVLANDSTTCGALDCGSLMIVTPPAHGTATPVGCTGTGACTGCVIAYTAAAGYTGPDSFTYKVSNNLTPPCTGMATVTLNVCAVNASNDVATVCSGSSVNIPVLANDSTTCGSLNCASLTITTPPANGTAMVVGCTGTGACAGCSVKYTPNAGFVGSDSFAYRVANDQSPACVGQATVNVTVCAVTATNANATVCAGSSVDVPIHATTSCGQIDCSTLMVVTPPQHGTATPNGATCSFHYIAAPGYAGPDSFTFKISNGQSRACSGQGTVNVTINAAPTVVGDKAVRDPNSAVAITIHVLDNDLPGAGCSFDFNSLMITNQTGLCGNAVVDHVNGTVVYTPTVTPCAQIDSFDYTVCNTCGCCGSAHVEINTSCFERNRRQCASLLLYPEFDNSTAAKTLITVTMGCCEPTVGSTLVEFRFINKNNCQETNTTFTLTPCDTLTFLSSAVNPNQQHGYLYAYAKNATPSPNNPTGTPIVFNHLIGDELIIDGIQVLDYGMNAVAFKGYGADGMDVADGTPNDDDGDGIRDLNGPDAPNPEYDEAPDRILIPRFLGQDVPGGTTYANSKIILINLSGGSAFTTTLSIEGFNDNEVAFSDQFTFYCWAKPDLRDFSAFTLQSFLVNSGSDPAGTLGLAEETGWLNLDGLDASSSQESIHDPAFYAVLIEQLNGSFGADLPWEFCSQTNGSLLSTSLLGDGDPTPTNGDNQ
jgi:hypothetical protein